MNNPWMLTSQGVEFDLMEPTPDMVNIQDVSFHLARIRRFNGATLANCSVALHSVIVSHLVPEEYAVAALLHDAHEAYIGDISTPVKMMIGAEFAHLNHMIKEVVWRRFKYKRSPLSHVHVRKADLESLLFERDLFMPHCLRPWEVLAGVEFPSKAEKFLSYYHEGDPLVHDRLFIDRARELGL